MAWKKNTASDYVILHQELFKNNSIEKASELELKKAIILRFGSSNATYINTIKSLQALDLIIINEDRSATNLLYGATQNGNDTRAAE